MVAVPTPLRVCGIADEGARSLVDQLDLHAQLGLTAIEVRSIDGLLLHELDAQGMDRVAGLIERHGFEVPVVDTPIGGWATSLVTPFTDELDLLNAYIQRARRLGCSRLRVMSYPNDGRSDQDWRREALRRVGALVTVAGRHGVTLLHENCAGWAARRAEAIVDMLHTIADEHLRVLFDAGNGLAYGYDALAMLHEVRPWVDHVHIKDGQVRGEGEVTWVLPGDGSLNLPEIVKVLRSGGYSGWYSLEPHVAHVPHLRRSSPAEELAASYTAAVTGFRTLVAATAT